MLDNLINPGHNRIHEYKILPATETSAQGRSAPIKPAVEAMACLWHDPFFDMVMISSVLFHENPHRI